MFLFKRIDTENQGNDFIEEDFVIYTLSCPRCGNVWESGEPFPKTCPACGEDLEVGEHNAADN